MIRKLIRAAAVAVVPLGMAAAVASAGPATAAAVHPATVAAHEAAQVAAVHAAAARAQAAPPCPAGYSPITNQAGFAIAGNGVNHPVTIGATGNCFKAMDPNSCGSGCTSYCYQNGSGNALFNSSGTMEVGGACHASGHPNEQIAGQSFIGGQGWVLVSMTNGNIIQPDVCGEGGSEVHAVASGFHCDRWTV